MDSGGEVTRVEKRRRKKARVEKNAEVEGADQVEETEEVGRTDTVGEADEAKSTDGLREACEVDEATNSKGVKETNTVDGVSMEALEEDMTIEEFQTLIAPKEKGGATSSNEKGQVSRNEADLVTAISRKQKLVGAGMEMEENMALV